MRQSLHHFLTSWRYAHAVLLLLATLSACTLTLPSQASLTDDPTMREGQRLANIVWHKMQLGYLTQGHYDTNALADIRMADGFKLEVRQYQLADFLVVISHESLSKQAWYVAPEGINIKKP